MPAPVYITVIGLWALAVAVCYATGFQPYLPDAFDFGAFILALGARSAWFRGRYPLLRPLGIAAELPFIGVAVSTGPALSYAVQAFNNPLQDAAFLAFDRSLGFDYVAFMAWMTSHPTLYTDLGLIYAKFSQTALALFLVGLVVYRSQRIGVRFFTAFTVACVFCTIISGLFPAQGAVILLDPHTAKGAIGASPLDHLAALRAGLMHSMPKDVGGIISFPSLHVGLGLLILFYTRRAPVLLAVFGPIAVVFMFTAISHGAHYIADAVAAVPMIAASILVTEAMFRRRNPARQLVAQAA